MTPQNTTETRSRLKRYLSQYYLAKERQSILRQRLADLQAELRHPSVQVQPVTGTRNKGRRPGGGAATLTLKIGDIEDRIQQQMEIEARSVTEIMDALDLLPPGSLERDILEYRHIDCKSWEEIQQLVHLTRSPCFEYYNRGLGMLLTYKKVRTALADFEARSQQHGKKAP